MIIFGTGSKDLGTKKLQGTKCENCDSSDMYVQGFMKYFDIFWIPVFPYSKKLFTVCGHCKQALEGKEMSQQLKDKVNMQKNDFASPWYLFAGLFLIVLGISFGAYSSNKHKNEVAESMKHLLPNDILVFKEKYNEYTFAKVNFVSNDTIYLNGANYSLEGGKPSKYEFNKKIKDVDDFFSSDVTYFTQKEIDSLYKTKDIVELFKETK